MRLSLAFGLDHGGNDVPARLGPELEGDAAGLMSGNAIDPRGEGPGDELS